MSKQLTTIVVFLLCLTTIVSIAVATGVVWQGQRHLATVPGPLKPEPAAPAQPPTLTVKSDPLVASLESWVGGSYRHKSGAASYHVRVFVDYLEGGVKKRALYGTCTIDPHLPDNKGIGLSDQEHGRTSLSQDEGFVIVDPQGQRLRFVRRSSHTCDDSEAERGLLHFPVDIVGPPSALKPVEMNYRETKWKPDRPDEDHVGFCERPAAPEPKLAWDSRVGGGQLAHGQEITLGTFSFAKTHRRGATAFEGMCVIQLSMYSWPLEMPSTIDKAQDEIRRLLKALNAAPNDYGQLRLLLAHVKWLKAISRRTSKPQEAETQELLEQVLGKFRQAMAQNPDVVSYREGTKWLLWDRMPPVDPLQFPKYVEEIFNLGPLDYRDYKELAIQHYLWDGNLGKNSKVRAADRQRLQDQARGQMLPLLRQGAEPYQGHPEVIRDLLEWYERFLPKEWQREAEFQKLLSDMRAWRAKGSMPPKVP